MIKNILVCIFISLSLLACGEKENSNFQPSLSIECNNFQLSEISSKNILGTEGYWRCEHKEQLADGTPASFSRAYAIYADNTGAIFYANFDYRFYGTPITWKQTNCRSISYEYIGVDWLQNGEIQNLQLAKVDEKNSKLSFQIVETYGEPKATHTSQAECVWEWRQVGDDPLKI